MRWIYHNSSDSCESEQHKRILSLIDAWWQDFSRNASRLDAVFRQADSFDVMAWTERHLQTINPHLMWHFGPSTRGAGHRLVITCETHSELRPLVTELMKRAPTIDEWEFLEWRPAESVDQALRIVNSQLEVDLTDVTVAVAGGEHHRIDLVFRWPTLPSDREQAFDAAFVATELLLGEQRVEQWVGQIQIADKSSAPQAGQSFMSLDRLNPTFAALLNSVIEQLPHEAFAERVEDIQWALLELHPEEAVDYPRRNDLMTAVTCDPDLLGATFADAPFHSHRYSRCKESFCYVKVDGADVSAVKFPDREQMEEAVREALAGNEVGCLIGSGTGLRYSYLELALTDVDAAISVLQKVLAEGNVPLRSWLLFHDADLQDEWVGIYPDSPTPPGE